MSMELFRNTDQFESHLAGQEIFAQGDIGKAMYVVKEGQVDIRRGDTVIDSLGPGAIFGEMAIIEQAPRSAAAVAATDCQVTPIDERRFLFLIQQTPYFAVQVMRVMSQRIRQRMPG